VRRIYGTAGARRLREGRSCRRIGNGMRRLSSWFDLADMLCFTGGLGNGLGCGYGGALPVEL
jgi:hypothetical protein